MNEQNCDVRGFILSTVFRFLLNLFKIDCRHLKILMSSHIWQKLVNGKIYDACFPSFDNGSS